MTREIQQSEPKLETVLVRLHAGDKDRLRAFYPKVGHTKVIRLLVSEHLKKLELKFQEKLNTSE